MSTVDQAQVAEDQRGQAQRLPVVAVEPRVDDTVDGVHVDRRVGDLLEPAQSVGEGAAGDRLHARHAEQALERRPQHPVLEDVGGVLVEVAGDRGREPRVADDVADVDAPPESVEPVELVAVRAHQTVADRLLD